MESNNNHLSLPEDMIPEILLRLPVESLIRFKCVCKSWLSLISDPDFAKSHFSQALTAPSHRYLYIPFEGNKALSIDIDASLLHHHSTVALANIQLHFRPRTLYVKLRGSCRGIVLIDCRLDKLILWNPSTGAHKTLPYPPRAEKDFLGSSLGYDVATDDYLVVMTSLRDRQLCLEIFSVRTNSWEEIQLQHAPSRYSVYFANNYGLFYNEVIHWNVCDRVIICLDLRLRTFSEIALPDGFCHDSITRLTVLGGCLAVCNVNEIWVMKDYKVQSSWTKYCDVDNKLRVICINRAGEIIGLTRFTTPSSEVMKLTKLNEKGEQLESRECCDGMFRLGEVLYRESLLSLP